MFSSNDPSTPIFQELDVDTFEPGTKTRLFVEMVHDGLGGPARIPLIVIRGKKPGPVFGVTSALHGNELNGIPVAQKLAKQLNPKSLAGSVVIAPAINIPGVLRNQREYRDGVDLNHVMPGHDEGNESHVFASRLIDRVVNKFDFMVDLHTASFGRVNSLYVRADMSDVMTAEMSLLQRPQIILDNLPADSTLRGAAAELGIPAFTIEIGDPQVFQTRHINSTFSGIRAVLCHLKMTPPRDLKFDHEPVVCKSSEWLYTSNGGLLEVIPKLASNVKKGDLIAVQRDVFGDLIEEYNAPYAGVVIGKSVNPVSPTGARILHLGKLK